MRHTHRESGYGFFCGGDPRDFYPDQECSTDAEREKHKRDCEAWERGERPNVNGNAPYWTNSDGIAAHVIPCGYGLGGYSLDIECDDPECPDYEPPPPFADPAQLTLGGAA
jgi:hypothetical protein